MAISHSTPAVMALIQACLCYCFQLSRTCSLQVLTGSNIRLEGPKCWGTKYLPCNFDSHLRIALQHSAINPDQRANEGQSNRDTNCWSFLGFLTAIIQHTRLQGITTHLNVYLALNNTTLNNIQSTFIP